MKKVIQGDPNVNAAILTWIINAVFAIALIAAKIAHSRAATKQDEAEARNLKRQDEFEGRLRILERESVTHEDLRRIENKIDDHNRQVTDRLDRILERNK